MSRTRDVLKNKNRLEKKIKEKRKEELDTLKQATLFKAKLADKLQYINALLDDKDVNEAVIHVPDKSMALFTSCIYSEDMAGFDVRQSDKDANTFYIKKKIVAF